MKSMAQWLVAFLVVVPGVAGAVDVNPATKPDKIGNYLKSGAIDPTTLLAPPPANDSAETKAELATLHQIQDARMPDRVKIANDDYTETAFEVVRDTLGPNFTVEKLPVTAAFMEKVLSDEGVVVDPAKDMWMRPRPPLIDTSLTPCKPVKNTGAYPSGHATVGYLTAIVLSGMLPEKREVLFGDAARFAESRLICAVHYPSDVIASRTVAAVMVTEMRRNPKYKADFAAAKVELRRVVLEAQ